MSDEALVTDEVRAMIGRTSDPVEVTLTPMLARRAVDTITGVRSALPPPGTRVSGLALVSLESEVESLRTPEFLPASLIVANESSFERLPIVGETFTVRSRIDDITERFGSRLGHSVNVRTSVEFRDAEGAVVARVGRNLAYYDPSEGGPGRARR